MKIKINKVSIIIILVLILFAGFLIVYINLNSPKLETGFISDIKNKADFDRNGIINDYDREQFLSVYQSRDIRCDINNDGVVDTIDATEYIKLWRENQ